jgi:hypothetical protein
MKGIAMKISHSDIWQDTLRTLRPDAPVFIAVAGMFFFLPALLLGHFAPQPQVTGTMAEAFAEVQLYMDANWHWVMLSNAVNSFGAVVIYLLLFDGGRRTVGGAMAAALPLVPFYFILSMVLTWIVAAGLILLLVPGIYLVGRLAVSGPAMVAERIRNPFRALGRAWRLTAGKGWAIAILLLLVYLVASVAKLAITMVLGILFLLLAGKEGLGPLLVLIVDTALGAALSLLIILLCASIYRRLIAPAAGAVAPGSR